MCAIIGVCGDATNNHSISLTQRLFLESSYRGKHSMGASWFNGKDTVVNHEFVPNLADIRATAQGGQIRLLGHCRYSTSNLNWPLPLKLGEDTIAMNGVISQDLPANWPGAELEPYETGNDTEIALRYARYGMLGEHGGSFAVGLLDPLGIAFWRNGARPLWVMENLRGGLSVVASTLDILRRCGLPVEKAKRVPSGQVFKLTPEGLTKLKHTFDPGQELQTCSPSNPKHFSLQ